MMLFISRVSTEHWSLVEPLAYLQGLNKNISELMNKCLNIGFSAENVLVVGCKSTGLW
jgi:hypothetical protein